MTPDPEFPSDDFFRAFEVRRTQAIVARDMATIERMHAPEYQLITPSGAVYSRERYLAAIAARPFYASWDHGPMNVRLSPAMAVVRYRATIGLFSGRVVECWHTDTFELRQGAWQAVWSQATELAPATPAQLPGSGA